jgi:xanthine dehydrogenase accessory factor
MAADGSAYETQTARIIEAPAYGDYVLDALSGWRREGHRTALLTLVRIEGSSPRPVGSQMAVCDDGRAIGAITGGCAEQALILDAIGAIARGSNHVELYGEGSRFKDITLPCGSGIHIAFDVGLSDETLDTLRAGRRARHETSYVFEGAGIRFERLYRPQLRLVLVGSGHIVPVLAQYAALDETEVVVYSPDETTRQRSAAFARCEALSRAEDWNPGEMDAETAIVSLFHDHDSELAILEAALRSKAFYLGALGSHRTHARRMAALSDLGWRPDTLARLHGPVGLDIGANTPPQIAMSILSEVIKIRHAV